MSRKRIMIGVLPVLALSACVVAPPSGPRVMALPGAGKNFGVFQQEDMMCREYANDASGGPAGAQASTNNAAGAAVVGTALGAGLGAALGSLSGQMGAGAAIGGTIGALVGGSNAANGAAYAGADLQQRYDMSYTQCMYARGNSVQSPPGGYPSAAAGPYPPYYGAGYAGPTVVVGTGWGWGRGYRRRW